MPVATLAASDPGLGAAGSFSILGQTSVTNVPTSVISGNVGLNAAGTNYAGLTSAEVAGTIYDTNGTGPDGASAILSPSVQSDASTAFTTNIPGQGATASIGPVLDGLTVTPGVYDIGAGRLNGGVLTLNGAGIYIFRASSDFISSGSVVLINGARACDVYWRVQTLATINGSQFLGTILAGTGVHFGANVTLNGRALAVGGDVTLISDTIAGPTCAAVAIPAPPAGVNSGYSPPLAAGPAPVPPLISVLKVPTPLALPTGPGQVTYNYTVNNVGTVSMSNVTMNDDKCSQINFVSGDDNNDNRLDLTETWKYRCATNITTTTLNTVTATGHANGLTAIDTANATVVVGVPLVPPLIHLVKKPNLFVLPSGGGAVTYSYTVTNPGTVPLADVSITDDMCTGLPGRVVGHPGDLNNNNLLESNETWTFTCQTNIGETTTNTGTATGHANGFTAVDYSLATVVVSPAVAAVVPALPNTGFAPVNMVSIWAAIVGILTGAALLYYIGKKQKV